MLRKDKTNIGARDFLELYLDFHSLSPDRKKWNEISLKNNEPRLIRYQRLVALLKAFDIKTNLAKFHKGKFIDATDPVYRPFLAKARQEIVDEVIRENWDVDEPLYCAELSRTFEYLLEYRIKLERSLNFNSGVLVSSRFNHYGCEKIDELNRLILPHVGIVEDVLAALISPTGAKFPVADLARDFGYPTVDLFEVDLDNF